jgi:iron complex outermembrane receptor protein
LASGGLKRIRWLAWALAPSFPVIGAAESATELPTPSDQVEITATREPEPVDRVPAAMTIVTGEELRAGGAIDLRTALALVAGVEGTPGGDSGPAGAVPALWGLREADAFLLVVDGVPWGGAFNPATPSVDLTGVERIEILRGPAPVMYGATSFSGVIHVIHYPAGEAPNLATLSAGSNGTAGASATTSSRSAGRLQQSFTVNLEQRRFGEDRTEFRRYHALYRLAADVGSARFHLDGDLSIISQDPPGNLLLRDGALVHSELPMDANYNPRGASLDQSRYHLSIGLNGASAFGQWAANLAVTRTNDDSLRGFLRGNAFLDPPDAGVGDGLQADGYSQARDITDLYFDAHVTRDFSPRLNLTYGVDDLHGRGIQHATNFGYCIALSGQELPCAGAHHADEIVQSSDTRDFSGLYAQFDYRPSTSLDVLGGLRVNRTHETADGLAINNTGPVPVIAFDGRDGRDDTRPSGVLGASWRAWHSAENAVIAYGDYRNSFKPLATDFGPEAEVQVLQPETADSYELGAKLRLLEGALDLDTSLFRMNFRNGLTYAADASGTYHRANGAATRFQGFELESRYRVSTELQVAAHVAKHDARYVSFIAGNGADSSGNQVEMSPRLLGGVGLLYAGHRGIAATVVVDYIGDRWLNSPNSLSAGGYTSVDATLAYRAGKCTIGISGYNLTDRRDPVSQSELQETVTVTATAGYYRLPGRSAVVRVSVPM